MSTSSATAHNPLLQFERLPDFPALRAEHIRPAVEQVLAENRAALDRILADEQNQTAPDWHSLMDALDDLDDRLTKVWSTASHLNSVANTPDIRDAYNACQPLITEYYTALGQNEQLFACVEALSARADELGLDGSQRKILADTLLDFRLAGVNLPAQEKLRFTDIQTRLGNLANVFSNNVLDATRAWTRHLTDDTLLGGIPEMSVQAAATAAASKGLEGYLLTLDFPCYYAVMTYADNEGLREEMHRAFATRASDQAVGAEPGKWDNYDIIRDILQLRQEMATLLGYDNYAALSVARKMAKSVDQVNAFLDDLTQYSRPAAQREFQELCDFARTEHGVEQLNAWDVGYYSEKLRKQNYDISQEELRAWFPLDKVREGLFAIVETLYGVQVEPDTSAGVWDPSVSFYNIRRDGDIVARFYFDLFTREGKRGGAWMADCRSRRLITADGIAVQQQIPVAYLVCNFAPPADADTPALLTHNDVTTLFHEFGHGLHHMLTRENYLRCSGISGVAWDAVELPSQLMENWCWDPESIGLISAHYQTGEALPQALLDKMLAAKNFQSGMHSVRQLEFALFDFALHQTPVDMSHDFVAEVLTMARSKTAVYPVPCYNRFQNSFSHIFAGGYSAGYYSYKWAEVLSADVFSRFEETGVLNPITGKAFLDKILSKGGGADALSLFTDFMGREPDLAALLKQEGLQIQ
ncbi:M3 family metallopeptidase [Pseudohongiella sp.]|uniref:M3 family metallopeptidase n=1 Tax=Pseudohongiella sp. TaxID=1979412 RepID=UPI0017CD2634|nr:M3 family metallopeptidase [Pseudohongiella sp.]HDZ08682.1 M3 family peptidase [Pseudohongiella sp.]HEA62298.1 M3 family peptidase [Pseudohongiella sp.]